MMMISARIRTLGGVRRSRFGEANHETCPGGGIDARGTTLGKGR